MRRTLVIGGASLLGSRLCEQLLDDGDEVIAVDDFSSGSFATLAHLKREPRFAFVEHDITRRFRAHVDAVFHLAVPSSQRACASDPVRATVTSVMGTLHALEVAAEHGARIVVATSPERWGQGVRCAESLALDFARLRNVDVRIVRIASTYGPRMPLDDPHIVARLALQAARGGDLVLDEPADAIERLSFVDDAVSTLLRTMSFQPRVPAIAAPFCEATVLEIARAALSAGGSSAQVVSAAGAPPAGGPTTLVSPSRRTTPEALPASFVFGPHDTVELHEGIARTVGWFEARLGKRRADRPSGIFGRTGVRVVAG